MSSPHNKNYSLSPDCNIPDEDGAAIVRNIASFLTLSDATSMVSVSIVLPTSPADSWAVGEELEPLDTPATPALMAISPGATPECYNDLASSPALSELELEELLQERKRQWAQERLAAAVFAHPRSIRSYCVEAYSAATEIRHAKEQPPGREPPQEEDPETHRDPPQQQHPQHQLRPRGRHRRHEFVLVHDLVDSVLHNVPLSVLLELSHCTVELSLETAQCTIQISASSLSALLQALSHTCLHVWDGITNFNPFAVLDAIISLQVNAMGKTSEVLASGIQSVATGVGSASSLALHRLSRTGVGNLSVKGSSGSSQFQPNIKSTTDNLLQKKLLRKVSTINSAAEVISYMELKDDAGGLSRTAKSRVQRMMHYDVSLRPFVATIAMPPQPQPQPPRQRSFGNVDTFAGQPGAQRERSFSDDSTPMDSPFMCTPQSFPPTPASRTTVLARSTRFADDVIFLARDKIRVHDALASENERTREMARALSEGKRLAVFDAKAAGNGIELTCGQHLATKVGNLLYCSARSMVPILRNCFVYFEMTVMPRPVMLENLQVTLSIGLSTEEMPPNTLVGAWSGSVGLCTTGQILTAGQWCSPGDPSLSSYGDSATVGCLVCLDDGSAFETWDGVMITAQVTFNVNGRIVAPPVSTLPTTGGASALLPGAQMQMGLINGSIGYDPLARGQNPLLPPSSTLPLLVPSAEELYPTATLHSPASAVMCRFSAEDIVANSRESIGAPEGRTIYAVDGSVIPFPTEEA